MRILVCGDRKFEDFDLMLETLSKYFNGPGDILIHGCAKGADQLAEYVLTMHMFAELGNIPAIQRFPADWEKYGKAAGPIRNKQMLDEGKPDMVIAFLAPHSKGTKNMIDQAKAAEIPVHVVEI
jgi:hypothetical protein